MENTFLGRLMFGIIASVDHHDDGGVAAVGGLLPGGEICAADDVLLTHTCMYVYVYMCACVHVNVEYDGTTMAMQEGCSIVHK